VDVPDVVVLLPVVLVPPVTRPDVDEPDVRLVPLVFVGVPVVVEVVLPPLSSSSPPPQPVAAEMPATSISPIQANLAPVMLGSLEVMSIRGLP
jgi:hypothetical protein